MTPMVINNGDFVFLQGDDIHEYIVLRQTEHTITVKEWPYGDDTPAAREVLKQEIREIRAASQGGTDE